ncbi:MAG: hypothetical protein LBQ36_02750, partial [Synergistaceae bacterium]|nr:hypothetical protein [Synergistaceae bacterium]
LAKKTLEETADEFETVSVADAGKIYSAPWIAWLNMRNMLPLCEFVIESSLYRKESRGVFARDDHFVCDNAEWLRNTVVKADGSIDSFSAQTPAWPPNFDRLPYFEAIDKLAERVG